MSYRRHRGFGGLIGDLTVDIIDGVLSERERSARREQEFINQNVNRSGPMANGNGMIDQQQPMPVREPSLPEHIFRSFDLADEVQYRDGSVCPKDMKVTLADQLYQDYIAFVGYLHDPESADPVNQVTMVNNVMGKRISTQDFFKRREEVLKDPEKMKRPPKSLQYFAADDKTNNNAYTRFGCSVSRFLVNTFRDLGFNYIAFGGMSQTEIDKITAYICMMNDYLQQMGLDQYRDPERHGPSAHPEYCLNVRRTISGDGLIKNGPMDGAPQMGGPMGGSVPENPMLINASPYPDANMVRPGGIDFPMKKDKGDNADKAETASGEDTWSLQDRDSGLGSLGEGGLGNRDEGVLGNRDEGTLRDRDGGLGSSAFERARDDDRVFRVGGHLDQGEETRGPLGRMEIRRKEQAEFDKERGFGSDNLDALMDELNGLIGLENVKKNLNNLINVIRIRKVRKDMGLSQTSMSLHLVFSGNPGTGKTTVARLLAKIYKALGVVEQGQLVEVDRAGLVQGYMGQTAQKTQEVIDSAIGGVLFIDEAYTLTNKKDSSDYGQEAVDTLLKRMEDDREDFVVIAAGYTEPMEEFLESNPGLRSRFSKIIEFEDYTAEDLYQIFLSMCEKQDYQLTEEANEKVRKNFGLMVLYKGDNFANAREVRNFFERCIERQANRLVEEGDVDFKDAMTLTEEDVTDEAIEELDSEWEEEE